MIILLLFIFYILYFFYFYKWTQFRLGYSPRPLPWLPHVSGGLLVLLSIPWGFLVVGGLFWGFAGGRYHCLSIHAAPSWFMNCDNRETWLLTAEVIALALSIRVVYYLGLINGREQN